MVAHRIYRVPESPGRSSDLVPPPALANVSHQDPSGGDTHSLVGRGWGGANSDKGTDIPLAYVAWAGRYNNLIPARFLAPKECLTISTLYTNPFSLLGVAGVKTTGTKYISPIVRH